MQKPVTIEVRRKGSYQFIRHSRGLLMTSVNGKFLPPQWPDVQTFFQVSPYQGPYDDPNGRIDSTTGWNTNSV